MSECSVTDCKAPVKYKGLCGKHYKRQWRHGSATKTLIAPKGSNVGVPCRVEGCTEEVHGKGLCKMHWQRRARYGRTYNIRRENGAGTITLDGYRLITVEKGRRVLEHVYIAEKMNGGPLPPGSVVHHKDGNPLNNTKENLQIFASQSEHAKHHAKERARE